VVDAFEKTAGQVAAGSSLDFFGASRERLKVVPACTLSVASILSQLPLSFSVEPKVSAPRPLIYS
jgi:hypothetical protein